MYGLLLTYTDIPEAVRRAPRPTEAVLTGHHDLSFKHCIQFTLMSHKSAIVGSVVERKPISSFSIPKATVSDKTGFPTVQHRSKSAFARNRDELRKSVSRPKDVPIIIPVNVHPASTEPADWRQQISKESEDRVADMTEEQREEERRQILERFGASIGDVLV